MHKIVYKKNKEKPELRARCWSAGVASTIVACVVAPVDLVKTHMQTQKNKKGMLQTAGKVMRLRGPLGFYNGFSAAAVRQMTSTNIRFGIYEVGRHADVVPNSNLAKLGLSGFAGAAASICGIPMDLINVRMQNDMKLPNGERRNYRNIVDAFVRISREEGWRALYTGGTSAVLKAAVNTCGQIGLYDIVKTKLSTRFGMKDDIVLHFDSSLISSIFSTVISHPFDVLKTLMMNARPGQFPSISHALKHMMRFGKLGPFRGLAPTMLRKGPATVCLLVFYEQLRLRFGYVDTKKRD
ncbi:mitochondrial dicarboxylate carrier [Drosophila pseudoobscura]|uniref:Mitochondrial dicarboxylate carrier n=1 Tax=Drosophila pseudoobscura pseudoobscura TaxID=46245 RepID=A0A6I8V0P3_DROPS|nr:mitochondrial dicarboxylate carrier [Drosophila pseudoobscura]